MSQDSNKLAKVDVYAPPNLTATIEQYEYDTRITIVTFINNGNTEAPKHLKRAVLLPVEITMPPILAMAPDIAIYPVFIDSEVTRIIITVGTLDLGWKEVEVLTGVIELESGLDGASRKVHQCSEF